MLTQGGAEVDRGRGFPATALLVARQKHTQGVPHNISFAGIRYGPLQALGAFTRALRPLVY
jgi:hypothetical protein